MARTHFVGSFDTSDGTGTLTCCFVFRKLLFFLCEFCFQVKERACADAGSPGLVRGSHDSTCQWVYGKRCVPDGHSRVIYVANGIVASVSKRALSMFVLV